MNLNKTIWNLIIILFLILGADSLCAKEVVKCFHGYASIDENGTFKVKEVIEVKAEGKEIIHGIDRVLSGYFNDWRKLFPESLKIKNMSVTRNGSPEIFTITEIGTKRHPLVSIGSKDNSLPSGIYTYEINFTVDNIVTVNLTDKDSFIWFLGSIENNVETEKLSYTFMLPEKSKLESLKGFNKTYWNKDAYEIINNENGSFTVQRYIISSPRFNNSYPFRIEFTTGFIKDQTSTKTTNIQKTNNTSNDVRFIYFIIIPFFIILFIVVLVKLKMSEKNRTKLTTYGGFEFQKGDDFTNIQNNNVTHRQITIPHQHGIDGGQRWNKRSINLKFDKLKKEVREITTHKTRPSFLYSLKFFLSGLKFSVKLMCLEKELIIFALLQWVSIGLGYYAWVHILDWIPPEVWKAADEGKDVYAADIVLIVWSFVCVGIVSYPLGIFTSCMGAVYFIRAQGRNSTIAECLNIVMSKSWSVWTFTWTDSWITVNMILDRLPKKGGRRGDIVLKEALYYAWKVGTLGVTPALLTGSGLVEACVHSINLIITKFRDVVILRAAYSGLCWVVGIGTYIGTVIFLLFNKSAFLSDQFYSSVYQIYFYAGIPLLMSVAIIQLFLRPIYIISSCRIYARYLKENNIPIVLPEAPSRITSSFVTFCVLLLVATLLFLYRDQLGVMDLLSRVG